MQAASHDSEPIDKMTKKGQSCQEDDLGETQQETHLGSEHDVREAVPRFVPSKNLQTSKRQSSVPSHYQLAPGHISVSSILSRAEREKILDTDEHESLRSSPILRQQLAKPPRTKSPDVDEPKPELSKYASDIGPYARQHLLLEDHDVARVSGKTTASIPASKDVHIVTSDVQEPPTPCVEVTKVSNSADIENNSGDSDIGILFTHASQSGRYTGGLAKSKSSSRLSSSQATTSQSSDRVNSLVPQLETLSLQSFDYQPKNPNNSSPPRPLEILPTPDHRTTTQLQDVNLESMHVQRRDVQENSTATHKCPAAGFLQQSAIPEASIKLADHGKTREHAGGARRSGRSSNDCSPSSGAQVDRSTPTRDGDRPKSDQSDEPDDSENDQDGNNGEFPSRLGYASITKDKEELLACPYFKFDPHSYCPNATNDGKFWGCGTCKLKGIKGVKRHLRTVHAKSIEEKGLEESGLGVKRVPHSKQSQADAWFEIFSMLFGITSRPMSPYPEPDHDFLSRGFAMLLFSLGSCAITKAVQKAPEFPPHIGRAILGASEVIQTQYIQPLRTDLSNDNDLLPPNGFYNDASDVLMFDPNMWQSNYPQVQNGLDYDSY